MLGKLFVHEWKNTWKLMVMINGAVLILTLLGIMFAATRNAADYFTRSDVGSMWVLMIYISFIMVYILSILASSLGTSLYFYIRFYRNMYTDQGYLYHTLPVSEHDLILSRAFVAVIWRVIGMAVTAFGVIAIAGTLFSNIANFSDLFMPDIYSVYRSLVNEAFDGNALYLFVYILMYIILGIGSVIYSILMGYGAISLGQLASRNKVLASVGIYFGINILVSMLSNVVSQSYMMVALRTSSRGLYNETRFGTLSIGMTLILSICVYALAAGFYLLTHQIMQKKLNLD